MFLARHFLFSCFLALLVALVLGVLLLCRYALIKNKTGSDYELLKLNENSYQNIIKIWQEEDKRFKEADALEYPDPFKSK